MTQVIISTELSLDGTKKLVEDIKDYLFRTGRGAQLKDVAISTMPVSTPVPLPVRDVIIYNNYLMITLHNGNHRIFEAFIDDNLDLDNVQIKEIDNFDSLPAHIQMELGFMSREEYDRMQAEYYRLKNILGY